MWQSGFKVEFYQHIFMQPIYLNNDYPDDKQWRKHEFWKKNDKPLPRCDLLLKVICLRLSDNECVGTAMAV